LASDSTVKPAAAGILTTLGAAAGLALGPSVIAVLTISAYIQPIEQEFGWSRVQVSFAFTLVAYMIVLVSPLQGWCVDRFGPRRTVLASIPLFALSLIALYFTPANLFVFYLLWALVPIAAFGLWPLGYLQAVSQWFDRRLGFALGCANGGIGIGSTLVPLFTAAMIPIYGWRGAVLGLGILVLAISWPLVFWCLKEAPAPQKAANNEPAALLPGLPFSEVRKERSFIVLNILFFMLGLTATSLVSQQVPLLTESGARWYPQCSVFRCCSHASRSALQWTMCSRRVSCKPLPAVAYSHASCMRYTRMQRWSAPSCWVFCLALNSTYSPSLSSAITAPWPTVRPMV
jgi:MFS family permease